MVKTKYLKRRTKNRKTKRGGAAAAVKMANAAAAADLVNRNSFTFETTDPLPKLDDPRYIHLMRDYVAGISSPVISSELIKVLREHSKGFSACKFSALTYILISIVWVDHTLPTYKEKLNALIKFNFINNFGKKVGQLRHELGISFFIDKFLTNTFILNIRTPEYNFPINEFKNIRFETGIAFLGIVILDLKKPYFDSGEIVHYFIIVERDKQFACISSYGNDDLKYYQFETPLYPLTFNKFIKSLNKKVDKDTGVRKGVCHDKRIGAYMRSHFLNDAFRYYSKKVDSSSEVKYYTENAFLMVQFPMCDAVRNELDAKVRASFNGRVKKNLLNEVHKRDHPPTIEFLSDIGAEPSEMIHMNFDQTELTDRLTAAKRTAEDGEIELRSAECEDGQGASACEE